MKKLFIVCAFLLAAVSSSFAYNNQQIIDQTGTMTVSINATTTINCFCYWMPGGGDKPTGNGQCTFMDVQSYRMIAAWAYSSESESNPSLAANGHSEYFDGYFSQIEVKLLVSSSCYWGIGGVSW